MHQKYYELIVKTLDEENHKYMKKLLDHMIGVKYEEGDMNGTEIKSLPEPAKEPEQKIQTLERFKTLDDVIGLDDVKKYFRKLANYNETKQVSDAYGVKISKGAILYGAPGTGKTHSVDCLVGEGILNDVSIEVATFNPAADSNIFVNSGGVAIRKIYDGLVKKVSSKDTDIGILYLDEFDSSGKKRGGSSSGSEEADKVTTYLNMVIDGQYARDDIFVVCNTNMIDNIDPSYLRSGRLVPIECKHPNEEQLNSMYKLYVNKIEEDAEIKVFGKINYNKLANMGYKKRFTGADVKEVLNRSVMLTVDNVLDNGIKKFPKVYEKDIVNLINEHDFIRSQKTYDKQNEVGFK